MVENVEDILWADMKPSTEDKFESTEALVRLLEKLEAIRTLSNTDEAENFVLRQLMDEFKLMVGGDWEI